MTRLLLVDDEELSEPLASALGREGHTVAVVADGATALAQVGWQRPDLVILDLALLGISARQVCEQLRQRGLSVPVLILGAGQEETEVVACLEAGADDYVSKPFGLAELLARIRALLRRPVGSPPPVTDAAITIDRRGRRVFLSGREVPLTLKQFDLLAVLHRDQGRVVTRQKLIRQIWGATANVADKDKALEMHVSALRHKLDDPRTILDTSSRCTGSGTASRMIQSRRANTPPGYRSPRQTDRQECRPPR